MPMKTEGNRPVCCSFCGKSQDEVYRLLAGPGVYICNECIALCEGILHEGDAAVALKSASAKAEAPAQLSAPSCLRQS